MYKNQKIGVVVPCYNEGTQIKMVIDTMPDFVDHIIIVDDVSKDDTVKVITASVDDNKLSKEIADDLVVLIKHEKNQGVGGAIASGYEWCRDNGVDVAAVMAGDGQMAPDELGSVLDPVIEDNADYSQGNRLVYGEAFKKIPKIRYFGNSALSLLTKIASGYWHIADSQTGYTAINRKALETIDWQDMYKRYGQPNDLLIKLNVCDFRVADVPITPVYNVGEKSGIKVRKVLFTISWLLFKGFLWRMKEKYIIRNFHPLVFFYTMGFMMLSLSAGFFARVIYLWNLDGHAPALSAFAVMFSFSMGFQSIFFAMWFDMENNRRLH